MSKGKYGRYRTKRDQEEKEQRREMADAKMGLLIDPFTSEPIQEEPELKPAKSKEATWVQEDKRKWYVLDTNLILACVDIICDSKDPDWRPPLDFRPSLDNAHLIIPNIVFEELNKLKDGFTVNRSIARKAIRRLDKFFPNSERTLQDIMMLRQPIKTGWKNQVISLLPLHRDFEKSLPWIPSETDNDGWIAVTTLAATMIRDGLAVDGTVGMDEVLQRSNKRRDVVLLTNDGHLLSKADQYGVRSRSYSYTERPPFTGMRELVVPAEMFEQFYLTGRITRKEFEEYLPNESALVANEYIAMTPENDNYPRSYFASDVAFANVGRYSKADQMLHPMRYMKREGEMPPNAGIATYYDAMNDDENIHVIVVTGDPGTGKTYQIVRHSIKALREGRFAKVVLIVNSNNGVGYLPGSQEKKLDPMIQFCKDAIRSYLAKTPEFKKKREALRKYGDVPIESATEVTDDDAISKRKRKRRRTKSKQGDMYDVNDYEYMYEGEVVAKIEFSSFNKASGSNKSSAPDKSQKTYYELLDEQVDYIYDRYFMAIPYEQARGRSFEDAIIIIDEAQRIIIDDMDTFITRLAHNSLLVACGDVNQIRYNSPEKRIKNGLIFTRRIYFDAEGCANIHLVDNMRHEMTAVANQNYKKVIEEIGELQT